jgi:hypothetical protein
LRKAQEEVLGCLFDIRKEKNFKPRQAREEEDE